MSVTFYSLDAPKELTATYECQCVNPETEEAHDDCFSCNGSGKVDIYESPLEVQMSNANARDVLAAISYNSDDPLVGGWDTVAERAEAMRRIIRVLNSGIEDAAQEAQEFTPKRRVTREGGMTRISSGPAMVDCGRPAGYICQRLEQIQELLKAAIENNWTVTWS